MISFYNDYSQLGHPEVMKDLLKYDEEVNIGYGNDRHYLNAVELIRKTIGRDDLDIHFVHGGTMVNVIAIKSMLKAYEGVISCQSGHIISHENGAIEATGHQIYQVPDENGKITVENLREAVKANSKEYSVSPRVVYISNATEFGSVYTKRELTEISRFCKEAGLYLYMDGARLSTALASKYNDLSLKEIANLADIFTIGGTKNGLLIGEAMVVCNPELNKGMRKLIKQRGAMLAKGYLMGIQFETMFKDNLYFEIGKKSVDMAVYLARILEERGIKLYMRQESNLVFPILDKDLIQVLCEDYMFEIEGDLDESHSLTRFVTTWSTSKDDIDKLGETIKAFYNK